LGVAITAIAASCAFGQTNVPDARPTTDAARAEQIRAACVQGRRCVCGRILKVLTNGLVVECAYPSLLRKPLHGAWLVPGTVTASRDADVVESQEPDSFCTGLVFLTDLPRLRGAKVKPYDYVVLHAYRAPLLRRPRNRHQVEPANGKAGSTPVENLRLPER
jgi:hypothetical protein